MSQHFRNKIILQILEKYQNIWALTHLLGLAGWDLETYMPESGASDRGIAMAKAGTLIQSLFLEKSFVDLIKRANDEKGLTDQERGVLRVLNKLLLQYQKLPPKFIEELTKTTNEAQVVWRRAKAENDPKEFLVLLGKIVDLSIQEAEYLGYEKHPYDALLDNFEDDLTTHDVEKFFDSIREFLKELLAYIVSSPKYYTNNSIATEEYDRVLMKRINREVLEFFGYDPKRLRLDVSSHPFSSGLSNKDTRITTRYAKKDFGGSLMATIHEFGHSLYELQSGDNLQYTPIGGGSSLVIHESQSRFWENLIGRDTAFSDIFYQKFRKLGKNFEEYTKEDFNRYFNFVKPSLTRVEADEVTYHFHIMIRFEIEKMLISKNIEARDVPEIWVKKYEEYLGVLPNTYSEGFLQDIHWSMGSIGYFPTYSLGTVLSAQWEHFLTKELGEIGKLVASKGGIEKIKEWLRGNIHQHGSTYTFKELTKKVTGEDFKTEYWKEYLNKKYKSIY